MTLEEFKNEIKKSVLEWIKEYKDEFIPTTQNITNGEIDYIIDRVIERVSFSDEAQDAVIDHLAFLRRVNTKEIIIPENLTKLKVRWLTQYEEYHKLLSNGKYCDLCYDLAIEGREYVGIINVNNHRLLITFNIHINQLVSYEYERDDENWNYEITKFEAQQIMSKLDKLGIQYGTYRFHIKERANEIHN